MKRLTAALLALILAVFCCACGGKDGGTGDSGNTQGYAMTLKTTEDPVVKEGKPIETAAPNAYTISDEVIADNDLCTFTILRAEVDPVWGFALRAYCKNKSSEQAMRFTIDHVSVNGYEAAPMWAEIIAPGEEVGDSEISFLTFGFQEHGVSAADEIIFTLRLQDPDDATAADFYREKYVIHPTGLSPDKVRYPERKTAETEQVLADNENFCLIVLEERLDRIFGYTLYCYIENRSDMNLSFSWRDFQVNGQKLLGLDAASVSAGMRGYVEIHPSSTGLKDNKITTVDELKWTLYVRDSDDWNAKYIFTEAMTYRP